MSTSLLSKLAFLSLQLTQLTTQTDTELEVELFAFTGQTAESQV
jgi:hypothetical protein